MAPDGERTRFSLILVCSSYPPVVGGSEVEAQRVCSALIGRGHRVTVATTGGPPMPPLRTWTDPAGVPVRLYAASWNGVMKDVMFAISVAWLLIRERRNYQAVYFLMQGLHLAAGLPVARVLGKTILMKVGGSGVLPLMARSPTGRLELHWLRKWADRVMILNEGMRAEALAARLPADKLVWMPNPVDTECFSPAAEAERRRLRAQHDLPVGCLHHHLHRPAGAGEVPASAGGGVRGGLSAARRRPTSYSWAMGPMKAALIEQTQRLGCRGQDALRRQRGPVGDPPVAADGRRVCAGLLERGFPLRTRRSHVGRTCIGGQRHSRKPAVGAVGEARPSCRPPATSRPLRRRSRGCLTIRVASAHGRGSTSQCQGALCDRAGTRTLRNAAR